MRVWMGTLGLVILLSGCGGEATTQQQLDNTRTLAPEPTLAIEESPDANQAAPDPGLDSRPPGTDSATTATRTGPGFPDSSTQGANTSRAAVQESIVSIWDAMETDSPGLAWENMTATGQATIPKERFALIAEALAANTSITKITITEPGRAQVNFTQAGDEFITRLVYRDGSWLWHPTKSERERMASIIPVDCPPKSVDCPKFVIRG